MRSRSRERGQAATETMISMLFLMLMIWGLVHLSMFAVSKYVANYAAWAAARTAMVHGSPSGTGVGGQSLVAAMHVMGNWKWATLVRAFRTQHNFRGTNRTVIEVDMTVPFGHLIFGTGGGIVVYGRAAMMGNTYDVMVDWGDQK
jgi:Flp pilus assembly protein TadG